MPQITVLFDVNETLLDLNGLKPPYQAMFEGEIPLDLWFATLLQSSGVAMATNLKTNFKELAKTSLEKLLHKYRKKATEDEIEQFFKTFACLQPHKDVIPALLLLKDHGFETGALSNSAITLLESQMTAAGLTPHLKHLISVEEAGSFKPDPKVYLHAATRLDKKPEDLMLVAVHDWDTHGARNAGFKTGYVERGTGIYNPLFHPPTLKAKSLVEMAEKIITDYA